MKTAATAEKNTTFHVEQAAMERVESCAICGSKEKQEVLLPLDHTVSKQRFSIAECGACGFRFTDPRPPQDRIGDYYESEEYISHTNAKRSLQDRLYQIARRWALKQKFGLLHQHQRNGKVLDVGCGTGEFLAYLMGRGYQVQGVEPSLKAREKAIAEHGIHVVAGIDRIPAQEQFQIITLWHVLEHVPDPRATFKKLYALLADGGLLVIAVPDRESWDAQHFKEHWAAWDVPRHLSHFRRKDVHRQLHEHGFQLVATKRMLMDAAYISMLSSKYQGSGSLVALIKGMMLGSISNLVSLISGRPTSSSLYIAKKTEG